MVDFSAMNFPIRTPGAADAIESFKHVGNQVVALTKSGKEMTFSVDQFSQAWVKAGGKADMAMKILTVSARDAQKAAESAATSIATVSKETELLSHSSMIGVGELTRGLGRIASTGNVSAFAIRELAGGTMRLGASLGMAGGIAGLAILAGGAIVEAFTKARNELRKTQNEFNSRLLEMAHSGGIQALAGQGGLMATLQGGDPFAAIVGKKADEDPLKFLARSQGITGLVREAARLQDIVAKNPSIYRQGSKDADQLRAVNALIKEMRGELERAQKVADVLIPKIVDEENNRFANEKRKKTSIPSLITTPFKDDTMKSLPGVQITNAIPLRQELELYEQILIHQHDSLKTEQERRENLVKIANVIKQIQDLGDPDDPMHPKGIKAMKLPVNVDAKDTLTLMQQIAKQAGQTFVSTLGSSISRGFEAMFRKGGGLGAGFKALTATLLEGLGTMFQQAGEKALLGLKIMTTIVEAIEKFNPALGIPAAIALIAVGSAMKGYGASMNSAGSGGGSYSSYASSPMNGTILVGAPPATPSAAGISVRPTVTLNANIIGKDDPAAQRQLLEMISRAQRRGSTLG